jgi:acyl dehydratase
MNCDAFMNRAAMLAESGIEEVTWARPVRPGDRLHVRRRTLGARIGDGGADVGDVEFLFEVVNQNGEVAMSQRSVVRMRRRGDTG